VVAVVAAIYFGIALYNTFFRPAKDLTKYGKWAIVTGSTDGIGRAYAIELAKKGLNILLISRTAAKLEEVKKEILEKYSKVEVQILTIDYSKFDSAAQHLVREKINGLDVGVLVNNVGMSYEFPEYFHTLSPEIVRGLIEMNVTSTTFMTHLVLSGMENRGRGAIVNISSAASLLTPNPLLSQYSAAKSYIDKFSVALNAEYASRHIHVQVQNPLFVVSKLSKFKKATMTIPTPQEYVRSAVRAIGYEAQTSPFWSHKIQLWIASWIPSPIIGQYVLSLHLGIRKKALAKKSN